MEHFVLKWLASTVLVAVSTTPAPAQTANSFDIRRFFVEDPPPFEITPDSSSSPLKIGADTYTVDASGGVVRNEPPSDHPKNSNVSRWATLPAPVSGVGRFPAEKENKFSNISPPGCAAYPVSPGKIVELVETAAARYGVDPSFAKAIAWTESRYDQVRNSPNGARGPMQLMPETAARFGVSDACEPVANIDGGIRYLKLLLDEFGNPLLAAAAYNAGEQSIYDNGGVPPYPETVRYVSAVLNYQLGINVPRTRSGRETDRQPSLPTASSATVIGARPVTFVGGVVKF